MSEESIHSVDRDRIIDLGTIDMSLPELPSDEACLFCGATESLEVWTENGERVSVWYGLKDIETGEEGVCCRDCHLATSDGEEEFEIG